MSGPYAIPPVGSSGKFVFAAPFDKIALPDDIYTCKAVRKISDYLSNNEDVYNIVYVAATLEEDDYKKDLADDLVIVSLQSQIGHWLYVPVRFISSLPESSGIAYHNRVIAINLGAVPIDMDLSFLTTALLNVVKDTFGVTPEIKQVVNSKKAIISYKQHDIVQNARKGRITQSNTASAQLKIYKNQNKTLLEKIQALEQYILKNADKLGIKK